MINDFCNKMSNLEWRPDRYLMSFRFKTILDLHHQSSGRITYTKGGTGRHGVNVHVSNRLLTPLSPDHLQSMALSIPGLFMRSQQYPASTGLFHCGQLQIYCLPNAAPEGHGRGREPGSPLLECSGLMDGEVPILDFVMCSSFREATGLSNERDVQSQMSDAEYFSCSSPDTASSGTSDSDSFHSAWGDLSAAAEYSKWVCVEFKGQRYLRLQTPAKGEEADVESSWLVTDFTEAGGELVFSLRLDFIRPKPVVPRWMRYLEEEEEEEQEC
ncbi:hypothetical protein ACEWY4_010374 [Coilia grayii]|uniref:Uncharacterized protein n=1 Tax=Coilia grayii TaxID=363190 RepID=A0ABD1K1Q7_9TELE